MTEIKIYYDAKQEGDWFQNLTPKLADAFLIKLEGRGRNPDFIEKLLKYDRPDIILVVDGKPVLVLEKTGEVPTGHNVGQRFGRLVAAAENRTMAVFFVPFRAMKHGRYANVCFINARIFQAFKKMSSIHRVPILAVNWKSDDHGELIRDGSQDRELAVIVDELMENGFRWNNSEAVKKAQEISENEYQERVTSHPNYRNLPPSVKLLPTMNFLRLFPLQLRGMHFARRFLRNRNTLMYTLGMTERACRREDPYGGTQFIYDYILCRTGPNPNDKSTNLVLHVPAVHKSTWLRCNPNDPSRKSSIYYSTANMILLKDGVVNIR